MKTIFLFMAACCVLSPDRGYAAADTVNTPIKDWAASQGEVTFTNYAQDGSTRIEGAAGGVLRVYSMSTQELLKTITPSFRADYFLTRNYAPGPDGFVVAAGYNEQGFQI